MPFSGNSYRQIVKKNMTGEISFDVFSELDVSKDSFLISNKFT